MAARPVVLTAAAVARLKPNSKRREVPDGGAHGLSVLIHPSGAKSWVMRYRRPGNMSAMTKLTLGSADVSGAEGEREPVIGGHLTLAAARRLAAEVHRQRALGRDPAAELRAEKQGRQQASMFPEAARNYIEEHARPRTRRWEETARLLGLRPADLELIRDGIAYRWRDRDIDAITGHDIYTAVDDARRHGVPGLPRRKGISEGRARALASALSGLFGWLAKNRKVATNPCIGMHRPAASPARERVLSDDELRWLWSACAVVGEPFGSLVKLLLITGARLNEVAQMTTDELDGATWNIPGSRTKNHRPHTVPLPALAQDIIAGLKAIGGERGYLFTTNGSTAVSGFSKVKVRIDAAMRAAAPPGTDIPPWRLHDLRRTAATGMARAGADLHVIERALNHISGSFGGIVGVYQKHRFEEQVADALEAWSKMVRSIVEPSNVVPLRA
jgi:integrase